MPRIIDTHAHIYDKITTRSHLSLTVGFHKYLYNRDVSPEEIMAAAPDNADGFAEDMRKHNIATTIVGFNCESGTGDPGVPNDHIANLVKKHPDVFITAWGTVDPWTGEKALAEIERCIKELNFIGMKFHQPTQKFHPNDHRFYPLWDLCQQLHSPVQFHMGYSGLGTGVPGAGGVKLGYSRPIPDIEDIAADFPRLKIIMLHMGDPWEAECNALAFHYPNIIRETSGILPKYMPEVNFYEMNRRLQDKWVFGSDYNLFQYDDLLKQHQERGYRPGVWEKIAYKNCIHFLGEEMERVGIKLKEWE
ncbi:amidohydrolase family protein [Chloroflexota bacterium]